MFIPFLLFEKKFVLTFLLFLKIIIIIIIIKILIFFSILLNKINYPFIISL